MSYTASDAPVPEGTIVIERGATAKDVAPKLNRSVADIVRFLLQQGEMVTATQTLSDDMIELFAAEIGAEIRLVDPGEEQEVELQKVLGVDDLLEVDDDTAVSRPPGSRTCFPSTRVIGTASAPGTCGGEAM